MGHSDKAVFKQKMLKNKHGMKETGKIDFGRFDTCFTAKESSIPSRGNLVDNSEETTVHVDMIGLRSKQTIGGRSYGLIMEIASHRYVKVYLRTRESKAGANLMNIITWVDRNAKIMTKRVDCDNAPEVIVLRNKLK